MKVYCAWCGRRKREVPDCAIEGDSHGMCEECYDREMKEIEEECNGKP